MKFSKDLMVTRIPNAQTVRDDRPGDTNVITSQLRHFVIQVRTHVQSFNKKR